MFASLFEKYDRLVLFDTETTGLAHSRDTISHIGRSYSRMLDISFLP